MSDILETLQREHEDILEVFEVFKAAAGVARNRPFAELKARVRQHIEGEEAVLYPAVEALGTEQATLVTTAEGEHDGIETALAAIETAGASAASGAQVTALETALKDHIASERAVVFDAARDLTAAQRRQFNTELGDVHATSLLS